MNNISIGWIGLGNMGIPMVMQLIKAGYPVTVFNRTKEKEASILAVGASVAASPQELVLQTDMVFIMVSDDQAIRDVFNGEQGLLKARSNGKIFINMSTVSPLVSKEIAALCHQHGSNYLDAPVAGSVKQAEDGQLVIMVGGVETVFEKAKPVLGHLGKLVKRVGDVGAGNTAKLAINVLLGIYAQGLSEAIVFARDNGIATHDMVEIINNSAVGSVFAKIKGDAIINDNYKAAFALKHIAKDLRLAHTEGLHTPLGQTAFRTYQEAEERFGGEDIIAIIKQIVRPG